MSTKPVNDIVVIVKDRDDPQFRTTPMQQAAASCTGAILTSVIVTPLDVVKIRLQVQKKNLDKKNKCFLYCNGLMDHYCSCNPKDPNSKWLQRPGQFKGTMDAFVKISRTEGITSLWSGLSPTLALAIPATIAYFVIYEQLRVKFKDLYNADNQGPKLQPFWIPLISGGIARIISVTIVSPLELFRTKMQSQKLSYVELNEAYRSLIKQSGVRGLWKGVFPTLYRDVPFSAIYWMNYESIKSTLTDRDNTHPFLISFMSGAISGSIAATVTTPFDVVKTHQQIEFGENTLYGDNEVKKPRSTFTVIRDIHKNHGIRGLFAGLAPRLIKVAPACAIMISTFEYGKVFFNRLSTSEQNKAFNPSDFKSGPTIVSINREGF
ncbi:unnamed protein product [Phyllotreta striolata]|uniref:Solute carrier family 25 member 40 n=1 Tax=Phyllotreta striolata TaxID=444603 RepID=A0A9N9TPD7_PHYSR|nr:unnamed protein product [Phyllotreta striolata]